MSVITGTLKLKETKLLLIISGGFNPGKFNVPRLASIAGVAKLLRNVIDGVYSLKAGGNDIFLFNCLVSLLL